MIWVENKSSDLAEYIAFFFDNTLHVEFDICIFKIYIIFKKDLETIFEKLIHREIRKKTDSHRIAHKLK